MASAKEFFTPEQQEDIKLAVMNAELDTSGEIRVHIENTCEGDVMDRAAFIFHQLKMHKTKQRNGVLFYLAVQNRRFAILGDAGINSKVQPDFWDDIKMDMLTRFRDNKFTEGICMGVQKAGLQLKTHFPFKKDDVNELPDEVSFG